MMSHAHTSHDSNKSCDITCQWPKDSDEDSDFLVETMNPSHGHLRSMLELEIIMISLGPGQRDRQRHLRVRTWGTRQTRTRISEPESRSESRSTRQASRSRWHLLLGLGSWYPTLPGGFTISWLVSESKFKYPARTRSRGHCSSLSESSSSLDQHHDHGVSWCLRLRLWAASGSGWAESVFTSKFDIIHLEPRRGI